MPVAKSEIQEKIAELFVRLPIADGILKGSINKVFLGKRKDGKGERESYLLTYKGRNNKTKTVYVSKDNLAKVQAMIENYHTVKILLEEIVQLNMVLFKMK